MSGSRSPQPEPSRSTTPQVATAHSRPLRSVTAGALRVVQAALYTLTITIAALYPFTRGGSPKADAELTEEFNRVSPPPPKNTPRGPSA